MVSDLQRQKKREVGEGSKVKMDSPLPLPVTHKLLSWFTDNGHIYMPDYNTHFHSA